MGTFERHAGKEKSLKEKRNHPEEEPWTSHGQTLPVVHCTKSQGHDGGLKIFLPAVLKAMKVGRTQKSLKAAGESG